MESAITPTRTKVTEYVSLEEFLTGK